MSLFNLKGKRSSFFSACFSSPELRARVSFSDNFLSDVRLSVCQFAFKHFTFSISSSEPLSRFQPFTWSILRWREFKFVMKGHVLLKRKLGIIKYFSQNQSPRKSVTCVEASSGTVDFNIFKSSWALGVRWDQLVI